MTGRKLEQINRVCRVVENARKGRSYREIAAAEGLSFQRVSAIAIKAGIRRQRPKIEPIARGKTTSVVVDD